MEFRKSSIENLRSLGYTQDEANFLYLVAMHSGYFSARQYLTFTGAKSGEKSLAFTQKVLGKGHAAPVRCSETVVFITCFRASSIEPLAGNIFATAANIPSSTRALNWRFWIYTHASVIAQREAVNLLDKQVFPSVPKNADGNKNTAEVASPTN